MTRGVVWGLGGGRIIRIDLYSSTEGASVRINYSSRHASVNSNKTDAFDVFSVIAFQFARQTLRRTPFLTVIKLRLLTAKTRTCGKLVVDLNIFGYLGKS